MPLFTILFMKRYGGETGEVELKYKEGLTALFEARYMRKQSWGFLGGFSIDSERELDSFTVRSGGSSTTFSAGSGASKIQTSHLYANAAYLWETFYLAFGLNYSFFKFTPASGYAVSVDDNGGVGAQLGIGFNVHENVALEVWSRATYARLKIDTVDFGQGYLSQLLLQAKYIF